MDTTILDDFGKILMNQVRDMSVQEYEAIADGSVRAPRLKELSQRLMSLSDKELLLVNDVVMEVIDNVLFNLLNTLEEEEDEKLNLLYYDKEEIPHNIVKLSDGLAGELFTEDGWIYKFSKYPPVYKI